MAELKTWIRPTSRRLQYLRLFSWTVSKNSPLWRGSQCTHAHSTHYPSHELGVDDTTATWTTQATRTMEHNASKDHTKDCSVYNWSALLFCLSRQSLSPPHLFSSMEGPSHKDEYLLMMKIGRDKTSPFFFWGERVPANKQIKKINKHTTNHLFSIPFIGSTRCLWRLWMSFLRNIFFSRVIVHFWGPGPRRPKQRKKNGKWKHSLSECPFVTSTLDTPTRFPTHHTTVWDFARVFYFGTFAVQQLCMFTFDIRHSTDTKEKKEDRSDWSVNI